jgi:hypothetical protein
MKCGANGKPGRLAKRSSGVRRVADMVVASRWPRRLAAKELERDYRAMRTQVGAARRQSSSPQPQGRFVNRRRVLLAGIASVVLPFRHAHAQSFPARAITLYCAFPAGGPTAPLFRALAESLSKDLGQPNIVENKAGA